MNNVDNTPAPLDIYGILLMTIHTKKTQLRQLSAIRPAYARPLKLMMKVVSASSLLLDPARLRDLQLFKRLPPCFIFRLLIGGFGRISHGYVTRGDYWNQLNQLRQELNLGIPWGGSPFVGWKTWISTVTITCIIVSRMFNLYLGAVFAG